MDDVKTVSEARIGLESSGNRKHLKFRELAEKRTNKALASIKMIGNLSNRATYRYEDEEVRKIINALRRVVSDVETRFKRGVGDVDGDFRL